MQCHCVIAIFANGDLNFPETLQTPKSLNNCGTSRTIDDAKHIALATKKRYKITLQTMR